MARVVARAIPPAGEGRRMVSNPEWIKKFSIRGNELYSYSFHLEMLCLKIIIIIIFLYGITILNRS